MNHYPKGTTMTEHEVLDGLMLAGLIIGMAAFALAGFALMLLNKAAISAKPRYKHHPNPHPRPDPNHDTHEAFPS